MKRKPLMAWARFVLTPVLFLLGVFVPFGVALVGGPASFVLPAAASGVGAAVLAVAVAVIPRPIIVMRWVAILVVIYLPVPYQRFGFSWGTDTAGLAFDIIYIGTLSLTALVAALDHQHRDVPGP